MAVLERYNSSVHDLYVYDQEATRGGLTGNPIGYNPSCWANGNNVDFTGVALRVRKFNNLYNAHCFPLCVPDNYDPDINNINFYNSSQYPVTLVTPRHAFINEHFWDSCDYGACWNNCIPYCDKLVWMNKAGVKYERTPSGPLVDPSTGSHFQTDNDDLWIELDEPLPPDSGIKIYDKFARLYNTQKYANCYNVDPNGKIYLRNFDAVTVNEGVDLNASNPDVDYHGGQLIYSGDSGTVTFIQSEEHGTLLASNPNGNPYGHGGNYWRGQWTDDMISKLNTFLDTRPGGYSVSSIEVEDAVKYVSVASGSSYSPSTYMNGKKLFCRVKAIGRVPTNTDTEDSNYINAYVDGDAPTFGSISLEPTIHQDPTIPLSIFRGTSASMNVYDLLPGWPPVSMISTFAGDKNSKEAFSLAVTGASRNETIVADIPIGLCGSSLTVDNSFVNVIGAVHGATSATLSDFGITGATVGSITFNPNPPEAGESLTITTAVTGNPVPRQTFLIQAITGGPGGTYTLVEQFPWVGFTFPINSEINIDIPVEFVGTGLTFTWLAENGYNKGTLGTITGEKIV
jgi:hypothetical protein